ncbi:galactose oxidase [Sarocladium strictum]
MMLPKLQHLLFHVSALTSVALAGPVCSPKGWKILSPIAVAPRQEQATVALSDTQLAIIGGIVPNEAGTGFDTTTMVQIYDIPSDSWSTAEPLPVPLNHPNAAVVDGKIYVLGGLTPDENGSWNATRGCWVYDPEGDDGWLELGDMPEGEERGSATMGVHGSKIILAGGMEVLVPGPGNEQRTVSRVTAYDTATREWSVWPDLPVERDHAGGAVVDERLYVLGGRRFGQRNVTDTVFSIDLEHPEEDWMLSEARMPTPRGGLAAGTVTVKDKKDGKKKTLVYTFGGEGNPEDGSEGMFDQVEVFDPRDGGSWTKVAEGMPVPKHGTAAVGIGGGVYIPGGGITEGGSPVDAFEVYFP